MQDPFIFITNNRNKLILNEDGYLLMLYSRIPDKIKFKHPAVNDYNQHLCGGWTVYPHREFEEIDRVVNGLKPVGISHSKNLLELTRRAILYTSKGFLVSHVKNPHIKGMYDITVSVAGKLKDYFNMETLAKDYKRCGISGSNIKKYKNIDFGEFHYNKYDIEYHPDEITGLILGYPIENTISLMLCKDATAAIHAGDGTVFMEGEDAKQFTNQCNDRFNELAHN